MVLCRQFTLIRAPEYVPTGFVPVSEDDEQVGGPFFLVTLNCT